MILLIGHFIIKKKKYIYIYIYLAVLDLSCSTWALHCAMWDVLAVHGLSSCGTWV